MTCHCKEFLAPITTYDDLVTAAAERPAKLEPTLDVVAEDVARYMAVARCRACGRTWAREDWEERFAPLSAYYVVETTDPKGWLIGAPSLVDKLRTEREDRAFYEMLKKDETTAPCAVSGCPLPRVRNVVYCRRHQFESVKGRAWGGGD